MTTTQLSKTGSKTTKKNYHAISGKLVTTKRPGQICSHL